MINKWDIVRLIVGVVLLVAIVNTAEASGPNKRLLKTIYTVSKRHGIDAQNMVRIAYIESRFKVDAIRVNKNGTIDYGMFQINSIHWTTTCRGLDIMTLLGNANCAARIIKSIKIHASTDAMWLARYHSKTPSRKEHYNRLLEAAPYVSFDQ